MVRRLRSSLNGWASRRLVVSRSALKSVRGRPTFDVSSRCGCSRARHALRTASNWLTPCAFGSMRLEPVAAALWELVESGYWANWFCYLGSRSMEPAAELDRETMSRLLRLPGDLWLDLYSDDDEP